MNIEVNPLYEPIFSSPCRYFFLWGGRGRGASHFATDYFLFRMTMPGYFRGVMLRATIAQIKKSLWPAIKKRIETAVKSGYIDEDDLKINETEKTITYLPTGNTILCHGFRKTTKAAAADLKGLEGCTHAIVEEAEDVAEADFTELSTSLRTVEANIQIFVLFNPPSKNHWLIKTYFNLIPVKEDAFNGWYYAEQKEDTIDDVLAIHSTYKDNETNLNQSMLKDFVAYGNKNSPKYNWDYYCRSVLGLVSEGRKGRIFLKVKRISRELYDELPQKEFFGLDFGFNDPTAISAHKYHNGRVYSRQVFYEEEAEDSDVIRYLKRKEGLTKEDKIYADAQEEKTIRKYNRSGLHVVAAIKGQGSIDFGYREMLDLEWYVTSDSEEFWTELEEHSWELDGDGNSTDTPEDANNHLIDSARYAITMQVSRTRGGSTHTSAVATTERKSNAKKLLDALAERDEDAELDEDAVDEFYLDVYGEDFEWRN